MNIKEARKNRGQTFRLYPIPESITHSSTPTPIPWELNSFVVKEVDEKKRRYRMSHTHGLSFDLHFANIIEHLAPDMFILKVQYLIADPKIFPIPLKFYSK